MSASSSTSKAHACNNCLRPFATHKALTQHAHDTGHGFACAVSGCRKIFGSSVALSSHSSSQTHNAVAKMVYQNTKPGEHIGQSSKPNVDVHSNECSSTPADQNLETASVFTCTVSGCQRTFRSKQARGQHLASAVHKSRAQELPKDQTMSANTKVAPTGRAVATQSAAEDLESAKPLKETNSQCPTVMAKTKPQDTVIDDSNVHGVQKVSPRCLTARNAHGKKHHMSIISVASMARSDTATPAMQPALSDARWSKIAAANYASTIGALSSVSKPLSSNRSSGNYPITDLVTAPTHNPNTSKRCVIALDCEMVRIHPTTSELARVSAIDYLTGEVLIDTLVRPLHAVTDWRTQWSGITAQAMNAAVASGTALKGSPAASTELFKYMDSTTILVGHALHHDLAALGIRHKHTVDSAVLAKEAVGRGVKREWGLKLLCKEFLNLDVQNHGKAGHDSVEDALAAREVVLWCLRSPEELKAWGKRKKEKILEEERMRKARRNAKRRTKAPRYVEYDSDESEILHLSLEEFNEMCGYPPWYDNWSD